MNYENWRDLDWDKCIVCGKEIDYELPMCCNGYMCGCQGLPVEPPLCSEECANIFFQSKENKI